MIFTVDNMAQYKAAKEIIKNVSIKKRNKLKKAATKDLLTEAKNE